jgi:DNA-binding CsgD family transcriptional regulator
VESIQQETAETAVKWVGRCAERVLAARGRPARLKRLFYSSSVPMLMVDGGRRYRAVNTAACLAFRKSAADLRGLRIDDLTPERFLPVMEEAWTRLMATGCVGGTYEVASPADTSMRVVYHATWGAVLGLALIAFAPIGWPREAFVKDPEILVKGKRPPLTPRELEVLELAADGYSAPMIAAELVVSPATVRTHFEHVYDKLGVRDRAAAVATAMRLGLIA